MGKSGFQLHILVILGLCFTGLIVIWGMFYFFNSNQPNQITQLNQLNQPVQQGSQKKIHLSNPAELEFFETAFKFDKRELDLSDKDVAAGIIPHHLLAADLVAEFFYNLQGKDYETVVLIGPNHFNAGEADFITSSYNWQTPYGVLECDEDILRELVQTREVKIEEDALKNEHSINSEVAFIKKIFPKSKFAPIILKPNVTGGQAAILADKLAELSKNKNILVLASVDFSHYKDNLTAQKNDRISLKAISDFDYNAIYDLDIDSPAAIYALLKFSESKGAGFSFLNNSNSALLTNQLDLESTTSYVTGYFIK